MTAFLFTFNVDVPIPVNAKIEIDYPSQITPNDTYEGC